jgi:probable phosphoglycerate mutase
VRLLVEADGGSRGNPGRAGYGAVVRDAASGEVLAEVAEHIGLATNNVAEYRGLIAGLRAAHQIDPTATVEVRMDSKLVVEQMSGRWKVKHPDMRPLAAEARQVLPPSQVRYTWVPRERNGHADRLANEAMDAGAAGRQWVRRERVRAVDEASEQLPARDSEQPASTRPSGWSPSSGTPTTLLLLRHAETALTPAGRFSGVRGDPPLSEVGLGQAGKAAAALAATGEVAAIVASPALRARRTAEIVGEALGLPVRVDPGWRETDFGLWEGLTFAEVAERWPAETNAWLASAAVAPPDGESFAEVGRRVRVTRARTLARYPGQRVLVVSHVTPIKSLVQNALEAPARALFRMELSPASFSTVRYFPDGNCSLSGFNDVSHLLAD